MKRALAPQKQIFWTLDGYQPEPTPESFVKAWELDGHWPDMLKQCGYTNLETVGQEYVSGQASLWFHEPDLHLLVEISGPGDSLSRFFVKEAYADIFLVTRWIELVRDLELTCVGSEMRRLVKVLTAFVRHGHGRETIDECGDMSLDDMEEWWERRRERARAREKEKEQARKTE